MCSLIKEVLNESRGQGNHIMYHFNNEETYIQNAVAFIKTGVEEGSPVLLVENDRHLFNIKQQLQNTLSEKEMANVHFSNNYDFYSTTQSFDPDSILTYFKKTVEPHLSQGVPVWTWGLVEWGDDENLLDKIVLYESQVQSFTSEKGLVSVCAYDSNLTPDGTEELLRKFHQVTLTDELIRY
ncbi:MAG: MEDS domain-containing protein [Bacillota bacterium]